ncbi:MAG: SRPBCC family protein [Aestuariivirga sp.]
MNMDAKPNATGKPAEPYATFPAKETIRIERLLPGPVERVWSYLTDSGKRAKWFAAGPMELREGGAVSLTFRNSDLSDGQPNPGGGSPDGVDHVMHGVITRCAPPHLLAFNWSIDGTGTESRFQLSQEGLDTRLVITQQRVSNRNQLLGMTAGWHVHIGILIDLLQDKTPRSFWPEHVRLKKVYEGRIAG